MSNHQPLPRRRRASRRSRVRVAVILSGVLVVAVAMTAATRRSSTDRGSRAHVSAQPVQAAVAPPVQAPATAAPVLAPAATVRTPSRQAVTASVDAPATVGSAGQRTFIDPVSKRIREPEHDEVAALAAMARSQRRAARVADVQTEAQPLYGPMGAVGMAVPEELQTFVVATRTPDGGVVLEHATGPKAAQAKTRAGASKAPIAGKEEPNVR